MLSSAETCDTYIDNGGAPRREGAGLVRRTLIVAFSGVTISS